MLLLVITRRRHAAVAAAAATAVATLLAGCSSSGSAARPSTDTSSTASAGGSALARWNRAYHYLNVVKIPTEIVCVWLKEAGGRPSPVPRPAQFYDFADPAAWKSRIVTRDDLPSSGTVDDCVATVPTTVPYDAAIEQFLGRYGLTFGAEPHHAAGLTPIEIAYAGQNASDPDIIYRDKPGLFGLRLALSPLGKAAFEPGTSKIVQPADEATAARYLRYATPLLSWYGYEG